MRFCLLYQGAFQLPFGILAGSTRFTLAGLVAVLLALVLLLMSVAVPAHQQQNPSSFDEKNSPSPLTNHHPVSADQQTGWATYLGNEGVMVSHQGSKVLFDPFFHNDFSVYQLVPEDILQGIMAGKAPYDNIKAIFVSHAHGDHFFAADMVKFLTLHPQAQLIAPAQAIADLTVVLQQMVKDPLQRDAILARAVTVALAYGDKPWRMTIDNLTIDAVRIAHAGGPQRRSVENLVFRVSIDDQVTVIHMGDADPKDQHFAPYAQHWQQKVTDTAFPPYWFFLSIEGQQILKQRINAKQSIGIHVPMKIPNDLQASGAEYFFVPGQRQSVKPTPTTEKP